MSALRYIVSKSLRVASVPRPSHAISTLPRRQFSSTPRRWQDLQNPEELFAQLKDSKLYKHFQENPELKEAMQDAARILHEEGITPQKMSMMTMLTNKKVREAVTRVSKAASASGVDQETFMEVMEILKKSKAFPDLK